MHKWQVSSFSSLARKKAARLRCLSIVRRHPQVHMPKQKEVAFFSTERNYQRGSEWYMTTVLQDAEFDAVCGEASVAYMDGTPFGGMSEEEYSNPTIASRHSSRSRRSYRGASSSSCPR